jgi:hypothetical protein
MPVDPLLHQVSAVLDCFQYSQWTISKLNANAQPKKYKQRNMEIGSNNKIFYVHIM